MNQWDELADIFAANGDDSVAEYAADNVYLAWPSILQAMAEAFPDKKQLTILDYGCGGGLFCHKLYSLDHHVSGYDRSSAMIDSARRAVPAAVYFTNIEQDVLLETRYDLITSIMVMPFIDKLEPVIDRLSRTLKNNGVMINAVFNPDFIEDNIRNSNLFGRSECGNNTYLALKDQINIPVYSRTATAYRDIFSHHNMTQIYLDEPPFTKEFLEKYPMSCATTYPEYLIQGFRKR